ncbi:T9SS type A sorting domain-containing protein [Adhaeribacter soli]|uniref:T9SS type A sorting domain-containing protein n=1 Tax=Adhaeribacter soli TaxID=2607655 RepID=A0A5N1IWT7_9BACT|nr:T9SS type A sorting domain-containing protein [Adhaeribacter soli]KAA9333616.1 T9SS type A sorting domain-containing protein [Adhaeribacter soli]
MKKHYSCLLGLLLSATLAQAQTQPLPCSATIATFPYMQDFENGAGNWIAGGTNSSWALGTPGKLEINGAASGQNAWVTNLQVEHNPDENSQVVSPCFNFSALLSPAIELKIWWNSEHKMDGAVVQSSIDGGLTWQRVGEFGDPYNWYNVDDISAAPGGQTTGVHGWSGRAGSIPGAGSGGWVTARHKLTGLAGQASVRLRIAFASNSSYEDDGFAFDDIHIYDTPNTDAGVISVVSPTSACGLTLQESVTIKVKNYGRLTQTSIPVSYQVNNNPPVQETITTSLAPDDTLTYTFNTKLNLATAGTYTLKARTLLPSDGIPANDTTTASVTSIPTIATFPYFQNFETWSGGWMPHGTNASWAWGTPAKMTINAAASGTKAWATGISGFHNNNEDSYVLSPCLNFSSLTTPLLEMKVWWNSEDATDGAVLQSSIDGGQTWQNVGAFGDPYNWYNKNDISSAPGAQSSPAVGWSGTNNNLPSTGSNGWLAVRHVLTGLGGQPNVKLRIAFASNTFLADDGFAFDDVAIYEMPANDVGITALNAPVSGNCGAGTQENVTVTIKNHGAATLTSIPVTYQIGTNTPVSGTFTGSLASGASTTFTFPTKADLSAGGNFKITASTALAADTFLQNNSLSDSISIFNPIAAFPHLEDLENAVSGAPGTFPAGWTYTTGPGMFYPYSWQVQEGPTPMSGTGPEVDHTLGTASGKYVVAMTMNGSPGDSTELISPCINISALTTPGFSFWYHMAGTAMGKLQVQVSTDNGLTWTTLFALNGMQQAAESDPWKKKVVKLAGYTGNIKLKFKAFHGSGLEGDIALDDLKFFNIPPVDLEMFALTLPNTGCGLSVAENICVTILNNGTSAQSNFPVSYQVNGGSTVTETFSGSIAPGATAQYCFTAKANLSLPNTYAVTTTASITGDGDATNNSLTGTVSTLPTITSLPYSQDFENGNGGWVARGFNSSWALGTPAKNVINSAASGSNAWVTGLTGQYNNFENSYVLGPCFNFSALTGDPDIEMKAWWNAETGRDGAILQTSIDGGQTWQNVGEFGDLLNWYNDSTIYAQPGGQQFFKARGWTGTLADKGSKGWVTVKHKLTGMAGKPSVQLRIAFATDMFGQEDGFAFDDVTVTDNTHNLAVVSIAPVAAGCGFGNNETVAVELENLGSTPISNINMRHTVNGANPVTETLAGPIAGGSKATYTFTTGANLSNTGQHQLVVTATAANDPLTANNRITYNVLNALYNTFPLTFDFETATTGINNLRTSTGSHSTITTGAGASNGTGTTGLIMDGRQDSIWTVPTSTTSPWQINPAYFSAVNFCIDPAGLQPNAPLWLSFDLKQLFKLANNNTNFRVTVNGTQVGPTYRPPFSGTPISWQQVNVDLSSYKAAGIIRVSLESSVSEEYDSGSGTANLIDNIRVFTQNPSGMKTDLLAGNLHVFPNPSAGLFYVSLPTGKPFAMEVTDLAGRRVKQVSVNQNNNNTTTPLNLAGVAKGIYLLKISSEGSSTVRKLIVE